MHFTDAILLAPNKHTSLAICHFMATLHTTSDGQIYYYCNIENELLLHSSPVPFWKRVHVCHFKETKSATMNVFRNFLFFF